MIFLDFLKFIKGKIQYHVNKYYPIYYYRKSYSQEGEDMILATIFERKQEGFYVDVGAYHPTRFSNTYYFYKLGWRGINIDAMPDSMELFKKLRPRDINLELAVNDQKELLVYYIFNEPALNGFSHDLSTYRNNKKSDYKVIETKKIETCPLSDILSQYLPAEQKIDFLSIDVEGLDKQVLMSNDWEKYNPTVILVECLTDSSSDNIYQFLTQRNYGLHAKTGRTNIFKLKE